VHHDFGGGSGAELRILDRWLLAGSENTLRLIYELATPDSEGSNPIGWNGDRLSFDFWFSDLYAGRYLEMWFPANLIFDEFRFDLEVRLVNTGIEHTLITNGAVTDLGDKHWHIEFPDYYIACSPMLVIEATDRLEQRIGTVTPLGSTHAITLNTYRSTSVTANLATVESDVAAFISGNITNVGPYLHGERFTTYIWPHTTRSMEYAGGVTTALTALEHEVFHSWFARGITPARQNDSWLDEAWTTYSTSSNRFAVIPLGMFQSPVTLASRNPFNRATPFPEAYSQGFTLFAGIAAEIGLADLKAAMCEFYMLYLCQPVTTEQLLTHLLVWSRSMVITDYFYRYVYGYDWLPVGAGSDLKIDALWSQQSESPAVGWQQVEAGQDNWFYATVRNASTTTTARACVVTFSFKSPFATPVYPADFRDNIISAAVAFDLAPGATTTVKARWPKDMIPPIPTGATVRHGCILAEVYNPEDHVAAGVTSIGASNGKLKQRNTDIVDALPDSTLDYFLDISNYKILRPELTRLEIIREPRWQHVGISLHHPNKKFLQEFIRRVEHVKPGMVRPAEPVAGVPELRVLERARVEIAMGTARRPLILDLAPGSSMPLPSEDARDAIQEDAFIAPADPDFMRMDADWVPMEAGAHLAIRSGTRVGLPVVMKPRDRTLLNVKIKVPKDAKPGDRFTVAMKQRNKKGELLGEFDIKVNVVARK
jgi:hypothetical protein